MLATEMQPGDLHGRWVVTDSGKWLRRTAYHKDRVLVKTGGNGFVTGTHVYIKSTELADRLDRGLMIR